MQKAQACISFQMGHDAGKDVPTMINLTSLEYSLEIASCSLSGFLGLEKGEMKNILLLILRHLPNLFYNHPPGQGFC